MISRKLTHEIIRIAMDVHSELGPGLLESAYQKTLFYCLKKEGYTVEKEKPMPIIFDEVELDCGYRIDMLVEKKLVLELKSVKVLSNVHMAQILTYLKLGGFQVFVFTAEDTEMHRDREEKNLASVNSLERLCGSKPEQSSLNHRGNGGDRGETQREK